LTHHLHFGAAIRNQPELAFTMRASAVLKYAAAISAIAAAWLGATARSNSTLSTTRFWDLRYERDNSAGAQERVRREFVVRVELPSKVIVGEPFDVKLNAETTRDWRMPLNEEGIGAGPPVRFETQGRSSDPWIFGLQAANLTFDGPNPRRVGDDGSAEWQGVASKAGKHTIQFALANGEMITELARSDPNFRKVADDHGAFNVPLVIGFDALHPILNVHMLAAGGLGLVALGCLFTAHRQARPE
jgi:hypothetical protein